MVNCDFSNFGCNGGYLTPSLGYLMAEGVVSEDCIPYENSAGFCGYKCTESSKKYRKYACKVGSSVFPTKVDDIKYDLMTNGPMMVGFTVYEDFMNYKTGIYEHLAGGVAGGHAVKLIGWDYDGNNRLYWIC
jgi:cathepsin B